MIDISASTSLTFSICRTGDSSVSSLRKRRLRFQRPQKDLPEVVQLELIHQPTDDSLLLWLLQMLIVNKPILPRSFSSSIKIGNSLAPTIVERFLPQTGTVTTTSRTFYVDSKASHSQLKRRFIELSFLAIPPAAVSLPPEGKKRCFGSS